MISDLRTVVDDCLVLVKHVISQNEITVYKTLNPAPLVCVNAGEMQQVAINLIINAVQAMGANGTLYLTLEEQSRDGIAGACMIVRDTGPGVPEDIIASVFDPFFTTKHGLGTGLGLSISQTLVQRAGGLISARNRPSGGAEFRVWLPGAIMDDTA
jgi:two-component system NtrC family sensor kinase